MTTEIKTVKQFAYLLPELKKEERSTLEESLRKEGCRDPIITWHGTIIDGHNRYLICKQHNIPFKVREMDELPDEDAVKTWIINNQLSRRNLTDEQRERFIGILFNTSKKGWGGARDNSGRKSKGQTEPLKSANKKEGSGSADTADIIAKQHGVSRATAKRAGKYAEALDRIGKVSSIAEAKIMSGEAKTVINKGDIRNLAEASEAEIKKVAKAIETDKPVKMARTTEKESQVQKVYKIINEIENRVDVLTDIISGTHGQLSDVERGDIVSRIDGLSSKVQLTRQNFL
jgi:hypothetical protein